jgi:putative lipid kinase YegS-like protein
MIRKGEPWGRPITGPPDLEVRGGDPDLAAAVQSRPGARVRFVAGEGSDLALAVGLAGPPADASTASETELPVDGLVVDGDELAVNMVVLGHPPDRLRLWHRRVPCRVTVDDRVVFDAPATTVVVANGQFLRGLDVVPRGHPGDGRCEVQVYALRAGARAKMRRRLRLGDHVPHPEIHQVSGKVVTARFGAPRPLEVDGRSRPPGAEITVRVVPEALVLLV